MADGHPFGLHRVIEPRGALPQSAWRLDNDFSTVFDNEVHISVETLNIDASSFRQMTEAAGDVDKVGEIILETVRQRGKQHNPVTGSGGMLVGKVLTCGVRSDVKPGDRVATLVSLSLTPIRIDRVLNITAASSQVDIVGEAVVFESGAVIALPEDFDQRTALAALDVCGAPAQVKRLVKPGMRILVLGAGGKSGLLSCAQARQNSAAQIIAVESHEPYVQDLRDLSYADVILARDAKEPASLYEAVMEATDQQGVDLSVSCVNVPGTEMSAILPVRTGGTVYFFSMTTSFTAATLGAEGVSKDVQLCMGNGYAEGHAELTLNLLREHPQLKKLFEERYAQ